MFFSFRYSVVFVKDKKIVWDWLPPFDLLLQHKDFQAGAKKSPDKSGLKNREEKKELLDWRTYLNIGRTFFEQGSTT
jgi:hypothetical protein